ncbi:hypothetical protein CPB84DRAFT_256218 [Gymnopilus junonius]|uniref:Uncharacterized protein n=1 Tax=Gymnopilus junonius TaxID=109634 RepID=A0A9P5NC10_GYMJU|nr:hypothetical protein CPB84DRAFT_256218 [Gymnopilus junonius]
MSNIRDIRVDQAFDVSELLNALVNMPLLERLHLTFLRNDHPDWLFQDRSYVILQHLELLHIYGPLTTWFPIVKVIKPAAGCSISIRSNPTMADGRIPNLENSTSEHLIDYIHTAVAPHTPSRILLKCRNGTHSQEVRVDIDTMEVPQNISIYLEYYDTLSRTLIDYLSSFLMSKPIKEAVLEISGLEGLLNAQLKTLLRSLSFISFLETSEDTLDFIISADNRKCFPTLRSLKLSSIRPQTAWRRYPEGPIMALLQHRKEIGLPIAILDLTACQTSKFYDMDYLDRIIDLEVRYTHLSNQTDIHYRCGTGTPEVLKFEKED